MAVLSSRVAVDVTPKPVTGEVLKPAAEKIRSAIGRFVRSVFSLGLSEEALHARFDVMAAGLARGELAEFEPIKGQVRH